MLRRLSLAVIFALCALPLRAQSVAVEGGNVVYRPAQGEPRRLTASRLDRDPALSPDGRTVAFVRGTPGRTLAAGSGDAEATEVWVVGVDGGGARRLLRGRAGRPPAPPVADMRQPAWSPDGTRLYVMGAAWATSGAVHAVDVATGEARYVGPGNSLWVVPRGTYEGHLVVSQHRYFIGGGSYDWFWLLTPDGREVGPVGETEGQLAQFREAHVDP